jgi:peptidoglycan hydrolase CwlO-like protein
VKLETLNIVKRLQETQNQTEKKLEALQRTIKETQTETEKKLETLQNTMKEIQNQTEKELENQLDIKMKVFQERMKSGLYHPIFNIVDFTQKTDSKFLNGNEIQNS